MKQGYLVKVDWDTDGVSPGELGLPGIVDVPGDIPSDEISDYLPDIYGFCVNSWCEY